MSHFKGVPPKETHPLLKKEIWEDVSWEDKKKRWDEEMARDRPDPSVLEGILHRLFSNGTCPESICFCLDLADGHESGDLFSKVSASSLHSPQVKTRNREIAEKAWRVLCDNFFKNTKESSQIASWVDLVVNEQVFKKILWFFSPQKEDRIGNNLPNPDLSGRNRGHYANIARTFLKEFIRFVWRIDRFGRFVDGLTSAECKAIREIFRKARPQIIEIAAEMKDLNFLLNRDYYLKEWCGGFDVDDATMEKLEELSFAEELWDGKEHRKPESVEKAFYHDSYSAEILVLLRIIKVEWERKCKLEEAERKKLEAEQELARLSGGKK